MFPNVSLQYRETNSTSGMCSAKAVTVYGAFPAGAARHSSAFSRQDLPELMHHSRAPKMQRAQGKPDAGSHPQPCVQLKKARKQVTTGSTETSGLPCAMVLTAASCSPWCAGLDSHHHRRDHRSRGLDSSVGESGPHDLAVRARAARRATRSRPPLPAATSVTTRTPLRSRRDRHMRTMISVFRKHKFCCEQRLRAGSA
jgi:hypothetical protein